MGAAPKHKPYGNKHTNDYTHHTELILLKASEKDPQNKQTNIKGARRNTIIQNILRKREWWG